MSQDKKGLQISSSDFDKLKERFQIEKEREQTNLNFGPWVSRKIGLMLSKEEWVEKTYPDLHLISVDEYEAVIEDAKREATSKVQLQNNILTCTTCKENPANCEHVLLMHACKLGAIINKQRDNHSSAKNG
jgi:hypothetical protein